MVQRCTNPRNKDFSYYGGRGISICDRWRNSFSAFLEDIPERPSAKHTLERRDNSGPYSPENCCWATRKEQGRNQRSNVMVTFQGKTLCVSDWANELGISKGTIARRLRKWTTEKALTTKMRSRGNKLDD